MKYIIDTRTNKISHVGMKTTNNYEKIIEDRRRLVVGEPWPSIIQPKAELKQEAKNQEYKPKKRKYWKDEKTESEN